MANFWQSYYVIEAFVHKKSKESEFNDYWNSQAEFWAKNIHEGMDTFRDLFSLPAFLTFIGDIKDKKILDVACGEGNNTRMFAKQGANIIGVDFSEKMLQIAQEEEKKKPLGIKYYNASWSNLSLFKDESFDIVLSTMALMVWHGYEDALKEFYRVLKPNGELFFSIIHPCFLTPGYTTLKDEHGVSTHRVVSNYFKEGPWEFTWTLSKKADKSDGQPFTSMSYHRTISTYINNLLKVGFMLKEIREPQPSDEACERNQRLKISRDVAPSFLFVHAIKYKG
ncbi:MAG: class I SAM-dependent methyltransferase [Chlamydiota bacterium]